MSRAKKKRARERRLAAAADSARVPEPAAPARPRIDAARRRAELAKAVVVSVAVVGFGAAVALSRLSYAGHSKRPLQPLAAPPRYVQIVRQNLLQAGIVAPTEAPPGAETASS